MTGRGGYGGCIEQSAAVRQGGIRPDRAEELIASGGQVSAQVLNEVASVARRKPGWSWSEILDITAQLRAVCPVVQPTAATHERGLRVAES